MGRFRWLPLVLAGSLLIAACNSGPTTTPGAGTPQNVTGNPTGTTSKPDLSATTITIQGNVGDARSDEGIARATILIQALTGDVLATTPASGSAGASGSLAPMGGPGGPGGPSAEPAPSPSAQTNAGRMGASAPKRPGPSPDDPRRPRKITTEGNGNFSLENVTPGTYHITAYAPGYQAMSVVSNRPTNLTFKLVPLKAAAGYDVGGTVTTAAGKPAAGATVVSGSMPGLSLGDQSSSEADGAFVLKDLKKGKTPIAAYLGDQGEIKAWALQAEVPVAQNKEKKTPRTELSLRAIVNPVILSGKVADPNKEFKPRQVAAYLTTEKGELALLTRTPDKEGYFRFSLPTLNENQTYHLIASGVNAAGDIAYVHQHNVNPVASTKSSTDTKLELTMPKALKAPKVDSSAEPMEITWEALDEASVYRVRLETLDEEPVTLWEGFTQQTTLRLPDPAVLPLFKTGERYHMTLSAIKIAAGEQYELTRINEEPWAFAVSRAPLEFTYGQPVTPSRPATADEPVVAPATASLKPSAKPVPEPSLKPAAPKPPAKPAVGKPTPKKPPAKPPAGKPAPKPAPKKTVGLPEQPRA